MNEELDDEKYESIPCESGEYDDETIPHDVIAVMVDEQVSLLAAWRIYKGLSLQDVSGMIGVSPADIDREEGSGRPERELVEKLAVIYGCRIGQIID
ncbi:helix-turn-helix domain-containing protein [Salmonella enterica subsp. enterica serovar Rubislaw]|nr:helix-turn-helix domain-containing protein [Salmonella enterica]EBL5122784.1 helix-turn-helix domain-containing protein [Salmonella enterica subsp. enterica serovar Rubislaw]